MVESTGKIRLMDVIVLLGVLVILAGLLLPAFQSNNRSCRRVACAARLGEFTKATQQFEMIHKRYPGYLEPFGATASGQIKVGTWAVALFPYIEQEPLYDLWADSSFTDDWNRGKGLTVANADRQFYPNIGLFTCPDDTADEGLAKNSFVCNAGFFPTELPGPYVSMNPHVRLLESTRPENGVFSNQLPATVHCFLTGSFPMQVLGSAATRPTNSTHIKDGLTQTISFAENLQADSWGSIGNPDGWSQVTIDGVQYAGDELDASAAARVHIGMVWLYRCDPKQRSIVQSDPKCDAKALKDVLAVNRVNGDKKTKSINADTARPSSAHTGVVNISMLGGSVTTMSDAIEYHVYQSLMTPDTSKSDVPHAGYVLKEADYLN